MAARQNLSDDPMEELLRLRARVAEMERAEAQFRESERRFQDLFSQSPIGLASYDADGRLIRVNKAFLDIFGVADSSSLQGKSLFDSPNIPEQMKEDVRKGRPARYEYDVDFAKVKACDYYSTTKSGSIRVAALYTPICPEGADHLEGYLGQVYEITERARREAQLERLNRTLKAQSHSSQAMMRATSEAEYLHEVCRIIVEDCGYKLVWIGFAEEDEGKTIRPAAYSGFEEGYLEKLNVTWADTERGRGPTGTAIRTGKPSGSRNMLTDPDFAPWRKDALERGYASSACLPLLADGKAIGAITIYAAMPEAFSEDETKLLGALADDLAFGITSLRLRSAHARAAEEVRSLALFPGEDPTPVIRISKEGTILYANHASTGLLNAWGCRVGGRAREKQLRMVREVLISGAPKEVEVLCGGRIFSLLFAPVPDRGYANLYGSDVTEHKLADEKLRESEGTFHAIFDKAAIGIVLSDIRGHTWEANPAFQKILGRSAAELRGKSRRDFTHPDDLQGDDEAFRELLAGTRVPLGFEKRYIRKDGQVVFVRIIRTVCRDGAGKPQYLIGLVEDITARKQDEEALRTAYREMEQRVRDRTAELAEANEGLQAEVVERTHAEEALRESESRFRSMFNEAPIGMTVVSPSGRILQVNHAFCQFLGLAEQELLGKTVQEITHPDDRDMTSQVVAQATEGTPVRRVQKRYLHKNGQTVWGEISVSLVRDAAGTPLYTVAQVMDVTARRRTEEALRESEERFRTAFENGAVGMLIAAPNGTMLQVNTAFRQMVGYAEAELLNRPVAQITHPDDLEMNVPGWQAMTRGETPFFRIEKRYLRKDGSVLWADMSTAAVRDADGLPRYHVTHVQDITERKRAEEALRASEERYRVLFEDSPVAVVEYDCSRLMEYMGQLRQRSIADVRQYMAAHPGEADRCFATLVPLDGNRAAIRLIKAADRNHLLKNIASTLCEETRAYLQEAVARLAMGGTSFEAETTILTLSGEKREVWMSSSYIPGHGGSSPKAVIATADLTELRVAEREIVRERQSAQLQRTETLAATGRLAAGIAHEINNPLQGIVAQLDLLARDLPPELRTGRRVELINDAVGKIAKTVSNLLLLHRPPQEGERACAAASVIANVTEMIFPQAASRQVTVEVAVKPPEAMLPLSTNALTQVLLNLLLNALDATPAGGRIRVEASQTPAEASLLVSDTGSGIPPEHRGRLFSPFFTTKGPAGTGLGLSVTRALVTTAGGTIEATDRKDGGTTFFIRFVSECSHT